MSVVGNRTVVTKITTTSSTAVFTANAPTCLLSFFMVNNDASVQPDFSMYFYQSTTSEQNLLFKGSTPGAGGGTSETSTGFGLPMSKGDELRVVLSASTTDPVTFFVVALDASARGK